MTKDFFQPTVLVLRMAPEGGPMKMMPFSFNLAGNLGFSLEWPQPGQTASTWDGMCQKIEGPPRFFVVFFVSFWNQKEKSLGVLTDEG